MASTRYGLVLAVREHLAQGRPITGLESVVLFGVPSLTKVVSDLRREGWRVKSRGIPYATAVTRIRKHARFEPPTNLPIRDIRLTEYWVDR
jgi:hypothetical protein